MAGEGSEGVAEVARKRGSECVRSERMRSEGESWRARKPEGEEAMSVGSRPNLLPFASKLKADSWLLTA